MISPGLLAVALKLQEAQDSGDSLSANDIRARLSDSINDAFRGTGDYGYYIDHFGDAESGDVIFCCAGDTRKASYSMTAGTGSAATCVIDMEGAVDVVPRTVYEEEADEPDHYAQMGEAFKVQKLYTQLPVYERFISKAERDAADKSDFAGKGKSYPILKPEDVAAAASSIGRAGTGNLGPSGLKNRIIAIAKRKGWTKNLPKAWQDSSASEAKVPVAGGLQLVESAISTEAIVIREAKADYEIKLIAPGKGSSAFYPAEVLRRDGPRVFGQGTHVYLNHATAAEEAQRPEGDVRNLAGVLTTQAEYHEAHAKGPGLYARMKVFADHAQLVEEKAAHVGMSIRASGIAEAGKMKNGVPVLKELTGAESVDVVTRAGAGGMILTESAAPAAEPTQEVSGMDPEVQTLKETVSAQNATIALLTERAIRSDARDEAARLLESVSLPQQAKTRVIAQATATVPMKDGALDLAKLKETVDAAAKSEGEYLASIMPSGQVVGMGAGAPKQIDPQEAAREAEQSKAEEAEHVALFERLGLPKTAALFAVKGRAA